MKHLYLPAIALLAASSFTAQAQTMKVKCGQITTLIPAVTADDMNFIEGGTAFVVRGHTFKVADVNEITIDRTTIQPNTLTINYTAQGATVTVPIDNLPGLSITTQAGHVSIVADSTVQTELNYVLSGTTDNGSFFMDGEYKARVELNSLTLTNPTGAAIDIANGKRIDVVLPTGTTTTLTDGANGTHDACLFVNGHAELKGGGTLNLTGNTKHAYASDEYTILKPSFGTLNVTSAVGDGMHVNQYLLVEAGTVNIAGTKGDCIDVGITKDPLDELNGQAQINGGILHLDVTSDDTKGLKTDSMLTISGGLIEANVAGNGAKGISTGTHFLLQKTATTSPDISMTVSGGIYKPGDALLESKCRGIKVKGDFTFDGGNINMTVTGQKAKGISVDGLYTYKQGTSNVQPS